MSTYTPAPLLKPLRTKGGTYYTFSTATNQYSKTLFDSNYKIAPSAFLCLKLPSWNNMADSQQLWRNSADFGNPLTTDPNTLFPKALQNYTENFIQYSYAYRNDPNGLKTVAEMAFWKTLRMLGAIDLVEDGQVVLGGQTYPILKENTSAHPNYEKVIKYVGDANILNHISKGGQSYTEVMIHVPVTAGRHEGVQLLNCDIDFSLTSLPTDAGEETVGLEAFDNDNNKAIFDTEVRTYNVGDDLENATIWFDGTKADTTNANKGDFDFNAILVYYDVWDATDPTIVARNLHGILLLDNFKDSGGGSYSIECFHKLMPSADNAGNAYVSNVNMKLSNASNQVTSEITINDYDNVSMILYVDALKRLNDVTERFITLSEDYITLKGKVDSMTSILSRVEPNESLQSKIDSVYNLLLRNQAEERISNEDLFELFNKTVTQASTSSSVDIKMFIGALSLDDAGNIYVTVGTTKYIYNTVTRQFEEVV